MPEPENGKFDSTLLLSVRVVLYVWLEVSYVSVYVGACLLYTSDAADEL